MKMIDSYFEINPLEKMLEQIKQTVEYKHWFFGHYHFTKQITDKDAVLYEQIIQIN
jgi:spore cortex formation protein SpoVR/YcgB (stage V sporulation)